MKYIYIVLQYFRLLQTGDGGDSKETDDHHGGPEFAEVFVIVWVGAMAVTINTKLLGGTM